MVTLYPYFFSIVNSKTIILSLHTYHNLVETYSVFIGDSMLLDIKHIWIPEQKCFKFKSLFRSPLYAKYFYWSHT